MKLNWKDELIAAGIIIVIGLMLMAVVAVIAKMAIHRPESPSEPPIVIHECWRHPAWLDDLRAICDDVQRKKGRILKACGNLDKIVERCDNGQFD